MKSKIQIIGMIVLFLTEISPVWGQDQNSTARQHTVEGTVTDAASGETLPGVNIVVKGTTTGTSTDSEGSYELGVSSPQDTLLFSFVGFQTQMIPVNGRATISVALQPQVYSGEEMVVVGYGIQTKGSVTGAVSAIEAEEITRTSATTTAEALAGKIPGITTRTTNTYLGDARPGSPSIVQIRNLGEPLFVIDGVPQSSGAFNNINVNDIESISILKDASASVYGFRAANGVVLVTTKDGSRKQSPQININGYYGWQNFTRYPFDPPANAYLFHLSRARSEQNNGQPVTITPEELEKWRLGTEPGYENYNQYDYAINNPNAAQYNLNASVSGGSENATYYFSVGHVNQDYVMKGHNFNRTNIQANLEAEVAEGLTVGTQLSGRVENRNNVAIPGREDVVWNGLLAINSSWPTDNPYANGNRNYVNGDVRYLTRLASTYTRDIAGFQDDVWNNFTGNFFAEYDFDFGLVAKATYSYTSKLNTFDRQRFSYDAYCYDEETDTYNVCDGFNSPLRNRSRTEINEQFAQVQLSYNAQLEAHSLSGVLAYELSGSETNFTSLESVPPLNQSSLIEFVDVSGADTDWSISRRASYIGRINYNYDERYLLEILGRYDGSYLYAPGKRWGLFPGISVGWRLTEEAFLEDYLDFFDELKLRASWGQAGQEASWGQAGQELGVDPWDYLGGASYGSGEYLFNGTVVTGTTPRGLPVTNLSWVTSTSRNIGIDFALFDNKLSGSFDIFERKLTGLPAARYDVLLPSEVGYSLPDENLESEANRGLEGILTYSNQMGDISFSLGINATFSREKILERYKPRYGNSWDKYRTAEEHRWSGVNWGYQVIGQFQTMEQIERHPVDNDGRGNTTQLPGDLIYKDTNNDGVIDELDERPIGYGIYNNPMLGYGFNGSVGYKGLSLYVNLAGGTGYTYVQALEMKNPFQGGHNSPTWMLEDRWHRADVFDPNSEWIPGKYPAIRRNPNHANFEYSDYWLTNVKYLRIKRVELGYSIPAEILSNAGVSRLRVYVSGTNLFSFDNMKDIQLDPEIAQDSGLRYPPQRVINVGFDITF